MGTHYKGSEEEILALDTFIKLVRATESVSARVNSVLASYNLTESQFAILEALYHLGPLCQKDLGEKLLKSGGNITMVVDNLEKQKFVKRERGEKDRRYYNIYLTNEGKELIEKVFPKHLALIVKEMSALSEKDKKEFQRMCKEIGIKKN